MLVWLAGHSHHVAAERELLEANLADGVLWIEQIGTIFLNVFSNLYVRDRIDRTWARLVRE